MNAVNKPPVVKKVILNRGQLQNLARQLGVRYDWHEPDEQDVNAKVVGNHLDNAFGDGSWDELFVIITRKGKPVAGVNLASLLAMACGWEGL